MAEHFFWGYNEDAHFRADEERHLEHKRKEIEKSKKPPRKAKKTRIECGWRDPKYDEIEHDSWTKGGRSHFCNERDKIHRERERNFQKDKIEASKTMTKTQVFVQCKRCKGGFVAKVADRKRGWGKFCSKSCKAQHQGI